MTRPTIPTHKECTMNNDRDFATITLNGEALAFAPEPEEERDPYCFVCRRCTDHVGEHDEEVALGMAAYDGGYVVWTMAGRAYLRTYGEAGRRMLWETTWAMYQRSRP